MIIELGEKYLITTDGWFFAPDGHEYKAAFGTVSAIKEDSELGIKTNRNSTNWFVCIGDAVIAGYQIHYAVKTDLCNTRPVYVRDYGGDKAPYHRRVDSKIYFADGEAA